MANSADFRVILILSAERSGTNLLADMLGNLEGNLRLMEIYHPIARGGIQHSETFFDGLQKTLGCRFSDIHDPKLGEFVTDDRINYFNALCATARDLGYQSLSCKIFADQILLPELEQILARPNLRVIFAVRRRIDRYISRQKARIVNNFINTDTTAVLPEFDLEYFLESSKEIDLGMDMFWAAVQAAQRPYTVLEYDRDINIKDDLRSQRVAQALENIGASGGFSPYVPAHWIKKQDTNSDWRDKISNGFSVAAGLAGLGLLDYAKSAPLMDILPTTGDTTLSKAQLNGVIVDHPTRRDFLLREWGNFRAFSKDPIVTITSIQFDRSFFAEWMAGPHPAIAAQAGVHFLKPTWSMQTRNLDYLGKTLRRAERDNPGHIFIATHVNSAEAEIYRKSGIRSIFGNLSVLEDDTTWAEDAPPMPDVPDADALMVAILVDWKNHHLAADLDSVHFIYGQPSEEDLARVRGLCPKANFINHRSGEYRYLDRSEMRAMMSRAKVFLALSKEEGAMRASTEALLAGLPVVSIPSIGGRDACYCADNSLIVDPTPQAVRQGVQELIARNLTRDTVRRATIDMILPLRRQFEREANQAIAAHLGPLAPVLRVQDVFGLLTEYQTLRDFVEGLK